MRSVARPRIDATLRQKRTNSAKDAHCCGVMPINQHASLCGKNAIWKCANCGQRGSNFKLFFEVRHLLAQRKYRGILVGPTGIYGNSCWPNGNIQEILLAQRKTVKGRCWPTGILQRAPTANGQEPTVKSPRPKRGPKTMGNDTPIRCLSQGA